MATDHRPLPDRWLNCPKIGSLIANIFVPFKTPLDENYRRHIERKELRWEPSTVLGVCEARKIQLGLVIDLTNSTRYYKAEEFTSKGVQYHKIRCRGHNESPDENAVNDFLKTCTKFMETETNKKIGVHCTHGFNRTGFVICAYMVHTLHWSLAASVITFREARDPGIYKADYLMDLSTRYGSSEEELPDAPPRPTWEDGPAIASDDTERQKRSKEFMTGISGVFFLEDREEAANVQQIAADRCGFRRKGFPGSQPVSMDIENVRNLTREHHVVSWKADGTRYMLVIMGKDRVYFLDRDNTVFKAEGVSFPRPDQLHEHLSDTVLDGEMVIDIVQGQNVPRFLIYDIICFEGKPIREKDFGDRVRCINKNIIGARRNAHQRQIVNIDNEPFRVRMKEFYDVTAAEKFFGEKFQSQISHEVDGLIFQPSKKPYKADRCPYILKWKPPELNTIDFRLQIERTPVREGHVSETLYQLYVGGLNREYARLGIVEAGYKKLNNKIVECGLQEVQDRSGKKGFVWKILRERTDKSFPNSYNTAEGVMKSIRKPVTKEWLFNLIKTEAISDPEWAIPPSERRTAQKRSGEFAVPAVPPSRQRLQH